MDYTDLYLHRSYRDDTEGSAYAPPANNAPQLKALGQHIDALVGGTLSAQEFTRRLEALEQKVDGFSEKLMNLTRLLKLSQGLQEEREAEYRRESEELRARLERQEAHYTQLVREVGSIQTSMQATVSASVKQMTEDNVQRLEMLRRDMLATLREHAKSVDVEATAETERTTRRLTALEEGQQKVQEVFVAEQEAMRTWVKRNMHKLKQQMDGVAGDISAVRDTHDSLSVRVETIDCKAQAEYKKLRLLLQQKVRHAESLAALVDKELKSVKDVAEKHEILRSPQLTSTINALMFPSPQP